MHILQGADVLQADGHDVSQGFPSQINCQHIAYVPVDITTAPEVVQKRAGCGEGCCWGQDTPSGQLRVRHCWASLEG